MPMASEHPNSVSHVTEHSGGGGNRTAVIHPLDCSRKCVGGNRIDVLESAKVVQHFHGGGPSGVSQGAGGELARKLL